MSRGASAFTAATSGTASAPIWMCTFDGARMRGDTDSWVDVEGNGWLVQANHGMATGRSGFKINVQARGWGTANTFDANTADANTADVNGTGYGYGYELRPPTDAPAAHNRVTCTNTTTGAAAGITNTTCA